MRTNVKLVIVGDGACGKTCALSVFQTGKFPSNYIPTVFESYQTDLEVGGNSLKIQLFDTAGQDDYDRLRPLSYPNTNVIMLLFDVCNPTSLENAEFKWLEEVRHFLPRVPIILCGNKTDLRNDPKTLNDLSRFGQKPVTYEQGMATARRMQVNDYMEFSALGNQGIRQAFGKAAFFGYKNANNIAIEALGKAPSKNQKKKCNLL